mgnify:CR=1 FL=1
MTLSAPNNPVDARGKASKRAGSSLTAVRHGSCSKLEKQTIRHTAVGNSPDQLEDRVKTDCRDAVMLAELHRTGELTVV